MAINPDSSDLLCEEVLAQARKLADEILSRAREEGAAIVAAAASEADKAREGELERARAEAARQKDMIEAGVAVETGRMRVGRVETLLESVYGEALRRLSAHEGFDYRAALITLASQAITRMGGDAFVVKASEADRPVLGDEPAGEIAERAGVTAHAVVVSYEPDIGGGGLVVEDGEGRRLWDNRFAERLKRMWPEMRKHIAVAASFVPPAGAEGGDA